jgi:hypothetical protein
MIPDNKRLCTLCCIIEIYKVASLNPKYHIDHLWIHCSHVPCIRYVDDIVLHVKNKSALERLLESSTRYLEEKLKLTVNREKSRTVSVFAIRNIKFLGFSLGRNGSGILGRVHAKHGRSSSQN